MKAILVDDERLARRELRRLLVQHPQVEVVGEAANAEEARSLLAELRPDLVFLDVQMPGESGFDFLMKLNSFPAIIFTTAFDQFAVKAFEFGAYDYLLKPVEPDRLASSLARIHDRESAETPSSAWAEEVLRESDQVFVRDGENCWMVQLAEIPLLESEGNYTRVYFKGERALVARSLNALEIRLDPRVFFRANRRQIINLRWVQSIRPWFSRGLRIKLHSGSEIEISRRRSQQFRDLTSL
jgi:two-component system LytT family response regulator